MMLRIKKLFKFVKGLFIRDLPKPKVCKCGKPGTKGYLTKDKEGKVLEVDECEDCFKKRIKKLTIQALKGAIHARGWDVCPICGLRGKHAPLNVKHAFKQYRCANGHEWKLEDK